MNALALALAALRGTPAVNHPRLTLPYANLLAALVQGDEKELQGLRDRYRRECDAVASSPEMPGQILNAPVRTLLKDMAWALDAPNVAHGGVLALREALATYDRTWSQG